MRPWNEICADTDLYPTREAWVAHQAALLANAEANRERRIRQMTKAEWREMSRRARVYVREFDAMGNGGGL